MKSPRLRTFSDIFETPPLAWKNPTQRMESHPYGVIVFDEAPEKTHYSYLNLLALLAETKHSGKFRSQSINCVYVNPIVESCWIYDYREIAANSNTAKKIDYVHSILMELSESSRTPFSTVLLQYWYATEKTMRLVEQIGKTYWCPVRANRLVIESLDDGDYVPVKKLEFTEMEQLHGKLVSLKSYPEDHRVKLFRIKNKNDTFSFVVTNQLQQDSVDADHLIGSVYWMADRVCE